MNTKTIVLGLGVALAFGLFIALWENYKSTSKEVAGYRLKEELYKQQVKFWKDEEQKSRAEAKVFEVEGKVAREVMAGKWAEIQQDIKGLKKINNLRSRAEVKALYSDTLYIPLHDTVFIKGDSTIKYQVFNQVDSSGYNKFRGVIENGRLTIHPEIQVPLTTTIYRKKKAKRFLLDFFPGKETVVQSKSLNPKVTITDVEAQVIKPRKKFLGIF